MSSKDGEEADAWRSEVARLVPELEEQMGLSKMEPGMEVLLYRMSLLAGLGLSLSALDGMKHMVPYWELQMRYGPRIRTLQDELIRDMVRLTTRGTSDQS